ncbi:DMT family transporter [Pararhizobium sp.]|uniref:DMT family transporter n=1 Tax=Pararhizobium sp. TaxID=1977563 RepID=UPI003FA7020A
MSDTALSAPSSKSRLALVALLVGGVAIGASPIFVRLSEVGPLATGFWRVALALLPLFVWSGVTQPAKADRKPEGWRDFVLLTLPGVFLAADLAAWHLSLHMTSVANATLLANFAPIFVTLGAWVLFRTHITRIFLLGLATALAGVMILKGGFAGLGGGNLSGDATAIVAAVFYAAYMLSIGHLRSRFSTIRIIIWTTVSSAICLLPVALFYETGLIPLTLFGWAMVVGLAFVAHAAGQGLIIYALAFLPPAFLSLTLLLQPVVAAILAWIILSEPVGPMQALGGTVVLAGILIARRG